MPIQDQDLYHGAAIVPMVEFPRFKAINRAPDSEYGVYLLNTDTALMVKYAKATNASGKWVFDFSPDQLRNARTLEVRHRGQFYAVFVCYPKAVLALTWGELSSVVSLGSNRSQVVYCEIPPNKQIAVSGKGKKRLGRNVPRGEFPKRLFS